MTFPLSTLIGQARAGDAHAIARLITRALAAQNIVAQGQWQSVQLHLVLESDTAIDQRQVVPQIRRGLKRLGLTCPVDTVWVTARRVGWTEADWRDSFSLDGSSLSPNDIAAAASGSSSLQALAADPLDATRSPTPGSDLRLAQTAADHFDADFDTDDPAQATALSDTTLVALTHLAPVVSYLVLGSQWLGGWPLLWSGSFLLPWRVVAPLVLLLIKGSGVSNSASAAFVQQQSKTALNFQLTMFVAWVVTLALMFVLVGFLLVVPLALFEIVSCIVVAVRAAAGKPGRYVAIRFVR